jgi:hypothetical protein
LYFAFEKIEKLYHSDDYENLKQEDRERVYQKLKEIKEEQKLINDTVGALGDALPAFSRGMLKGERFANWIGYKWNNKPEKKEKPEADWKVGLPPLIDIQLVPTATANTATPPQSTLNTATASINTPTGPAMPTIPATPVPAMTPPTP